MRSGLFQFGDLYGMIVVDAGFVGPLKVVFGAVVEPAPGVLLVVEPDSPDGPCRIAFAARFGARGVFAQQAACRLFVEE